VQDALLSGANRTQNERRMGTTAEERVEVLDEDGAVVDVVTRAEMRARNLRHRSVYVAVVVDGRLLTHQRAAWKDAWPSRWDLAFGGVCGVGETWPDAARRELAEEAGIVVDEAELLDLGDGRYESDEVTVVGRVYAVAHDGPFTFADGEVTGIEWVGLDELERWLAEHEVCSDSVEIVAPRLR
jgi:isopentenyldiphosphate isomerase